MVNRLTEDLKAKLKADEIRYINEDLDHQAKVLRLKEKARKAALDKEVFAMSVGFPVDDEVRGYWDKDKQTKMFADNETSTSRSDGERNAMKKIALELLKLAVITTPEDLSDLLEAYQLLGEDEVGTLGKGLPQHLGGNTSPNLFRIPLHKDRTVDFSALQGTALMPGVQWLVLEDEILPSPLYIGAVKPICLVHPREDGVLDCGLFLDLSPMAVSMDTAAKSSQSESFNLKKAIISIATAARIELTRVWTNEILNYHHGWSIAAQLHVRIDIADDEITITPEMAEYIAEREGIRVSQVPGSVFDFTGYPMVNAACRPRLKVIVLDEEGLMPHFGLPPLPTERMCRDNDGDTLTMSFATPSARDLIPNLLSRKDNIK